MALKKKEKKNLPFVMLLLCADFYVNMPGCGHETVHYRDGCLSETLLHFLGALLGRAQKKKHCAGPVGGERNALD